MFDFDPTDFESVKKAFRTVETTLQQRVQTAIKEVLPQIADALAAAAPVDTGFLRKSFGIKIKKYGVNVFGIAGVKDEVFLTDKGFKIPKMTVHLVRFGFTHWRSKKRVKGNPFWDDVVQQWRPILQQAVQKAVDEVMAEIE